MSKKENKKLVLTGGHAATTALSTIEEILRRQSNAKIYWIGLKKAMEGSSVPSLESTIFPKSGVEFKPIVSGRLQRRFSIWTIPSLVKIPFGFIHAFLILLKIKPNLILSFGGSAAFPVVFGGWFLRIPIIIHEQTTAVGRGNKISAVFSKKVAISRKSSEKYFKKAKTVLTGNPILTQIAEIGVKTKKENPPCIYVTGGSRGSTFINGLIFEVLREILKKYYLVHQVGYIDYKTASKIKENLPQKLKERYEPYPVIDPMQVDGVYKRADLVISRAGANTVSETIATKRPAIFIPIPWSYANEQEKNARFAKKWGVVQILNQDKVNGEMLLGSIEKILTQKQKPKEFNLDKQASKRLVDLVEKYLA